MPDPNDIIRRNLRCLLSPEVREMALCESVGGNAGASCYALNLGVDDEGRINHVGNSAAQVNAALRVYVPTFAARGSKLPEIAVDVMGRIPEKARTALSRSAWLWNLHRVGRERALVERFADGGIPYEELVELLRAAFPALAEELAP